jgi:hypothetical protein
LALIKPFSIYPKRKGEFGHGPQLNLSMGTITRSNIKWALLAWNNLDPCGVTVYNCWAYPKKILGKVLQPNYKFTM